MANGNDYRQQAAGVIQNLQLPEYDYSSLIPEEYALEGSYNPEAYDPFLGDLSQLDTAQQDVSREAQMQALQQLQGLSDEGLDLDSRLAISGVQDSAARARRQGEEAILRDSAERGTLGAGDEAAVRMMGNQGAANLANEQGNERLQAMLRARLEAVAASGELSGSIRQQDLSLADKQAQLFNSYQTRSEGIRNNARIYGADVRNEGQTINLDRRQAVSNANVGERNRYQEENLDRTNELKDRSFGNAFNKGTAESNALVGVASGFDAQEAAGAQREAARDANKFGLVDTAIKVADSGIGKTIGKFIKGLF